MAKEKPELRLGAHDWGDFLGESLHDLEAGRLWLGLGADQRSTELEEDHGVNSVTIVRAAPAPRSARSTSSACAACTRAIMSPAGPAPESFAPRAPAWRAAPTSLSRGSLLTPTSCSKRWFSSMQAPSIRTFPFSIAPCPRRTHSPMARKIRRKWAGWATQAGGTGPP